MFQSLKGRGIKKTEHPVLTCLTSKRWVYKLHILTANQQKKKKNKIKCLQRQTICFYQLARQKACFQSYAYGSERKYTRAKHYGRLKQEWCSLNDYLKTAYWYPKIPLGHQVILLWYSRILPAMQGLNKILSLKLLHT